MKGLVEMTLLSRTFAYAISYQPLAISEENHNQVMNDEAWILIQWEPLFENLLFFFWLARLTHVVSDSTSLRMKWHLMTIYLTRRRTCNSAVDVIGLRFSRQKNVRWEGAHLNQSGIPIPRHTFQRILIEHWIRLLQRMLSGMLFKTHLLRRWNLKILSLLCDKRAYKTCQVNDNLNYDIQPASEKYYF